MFTGIVEELGEVVAVDYGMDSARLVVRGALVSADAMPGASVAVNGVCLTVVEVADGTFTSDVMRATLHRTSLSTLVVGSRVNLERAVRASDRLGGHIVQGHVDGVGTVVDRMQSDRWEVVRISLPDDVSRYVVERGSIAVDGVSLTVSGVGDGWFEVSLIPTTLELTTLGRHQLGELVNLEVDVIAKYVERLLAGRVNA
ncbi:MAG TPA: riboflavin synthase [Jiangellaceae bacterium]|nr:riboflavin synthase [Jiangellaceae bacterium]